MAPSSYGILLFLIKSFHFSYSKQYRKNKNALEIKKYSYSKEERMSTFKFDSMFNQHICAM